MSVEIEGRAIPHARRFATRMYELAVAVPLLGWLTVELTLDPGRFEDPMLLLWVAAIAVVDLLPVPTSVNLEFSLSFPLQLAVALIYPPPVAAAVTFLGTSDMREIRRELPLAKALFIRAQMAASVIGESALFHALAQLDSPWYRIGPTVLLATVVGYSINTLLVAWYFHLESREPLLGILREMHIGVFGEFVFSYMGLALFSVLVAISFVEFGPATIAVFIAPLAFARQMFYRTHSLQVATDELAERERENEYQALHDSLTDLPNRTLFLRHLQEAVEASGGKERLAVMIMDLDQFKEINDTLGHHFGDQILQAIGPRLATVLREGDLMARLGGDEFGVVLPSLPDDETAVRIAERLLEELEHPLAVEGLALDVSASVGIAIYPAHSRDVEALLRRADVAMYAAKETGNGYEVYDPEMDRHSPARLALVSQIRPALDGAEFLLHYQPKLRLSDSAVVGVEALVRWEHPERGLVAPNEFIPLVERTVLLRPLTMYVLEEALRQWHIWDRMGIAVPMAVNLSPRSLLDAQLPEQVAGLLDRWNVPPEQLTLELTESFLMSDSGRSTDVLSLLSEVGVQLSIDDFGTGYSSLSYLKRLPIHEIKVDRSFVTSMQDDPGNLMIVRATVDLGRNLGLRVVAEGVEDAGTWEQLVSMGCHVAQGFFLTKPLPPIEMTDWLAIRAPNRDREDGEGHDRGDREGEVPFSSIAEARVRRPLRAI